MINRPVLLPTNRDVRPKVDPRWPIAFASIALIFIVLTAVFALVGWPRLRSVSLHYDLVELRAEVEQLRQQERRIEAEVELLRAPQEMAPKAEALGLIHPPTQALCTPSEAIPR